MKLPFLIYRYLYSLTGYSICILTHWTKLSFLLPEQIKGNRWKHHPDNNEESRRMQSIFAVL